MEQRLIRRTAVGLLLLAAACTAGERESGPPAAPPRNLVLVVVDTLRADRLQVYGYPRPTSPVLLERAQDWSVFENAQSAAPWTAPALLSLMTSLDPAAHGVRSFPNPERLAERVDTLAEILQRAGFETAAFTEGGYAKADFGLGQGFDVFPRQPGDDVSNDSNVEYPSRLADNLDRALAWLEARGDAAEAGRFFLLFHTYETHTPYRAPESFVQRFDPSWDEAAEHARARTAIERWNLGGELSRDELLTLQIHMSHCRLETMPPRRDPHALGLAAHAAGVDRPKLPLSERFTRTISDLYDAEIAYTDAQLERLWRVLDAPPRRDDTLVVLVSDHGEGLGEHGHFDHGGVLFEELLRVPLLLRVPGLAPRRIPDLVRAVDLAPTLLDLLGVDGAPPEFQGRSVAPLLRGLPMDPRPAFSHGRIRPSGPADLLTSIRDARYRLLLDGRRGRKRLFDLDSDPTETHNVASRHPHLVARLSTALERRKARDRALHAKLGPDAGTPALSPDAREDLKALGYLDE